MDPETRETLNSMLEGMAEADEEEGAASVERIAEDFLGDHPDCGLSLETLCAMFAEASEGGKVRV